MFAWAVIVIFIAHLDMVSSSCPAVCSCAPDAPQCPPGVGLQRDTCGCCLVCARQLNEDCSRSEPCDHSKGLECNYGASHGATRGICRAKSEGRPCEYSSRIYQNGESFQPNCKHQCTCMDGAVGCVPLCPQELSLPALGCANPRLVKVPGRCCEEWVCDDEQQGGKLIESANKMPGNKEVGGDSEKELTNKNELISVIMNTKLKSLPAFRSHQMEKCIVQTTGWSQCSRSCGTGISTRITNNNAECKLMKESRICEVRPCSQSPHTSLKKGKKCNRTKKSVTPVKFSYAGCSSLKKYRPRFCGSCVDGRCCSPQNTRTIRVKFRCQDGETFNKNVMMIESCKCTKHCPHASEAGFPFYRLYNDIHKFTD
uniref:CCN family member 1 precursor n=1 Tax=Danio rerio TaxID=7955 RepID=UPI0000350717|nr:Zgc:85866 [Danio rerio]